MSNNTNFQAVEAIGAASPLTDDLKQFVDIAGRIAARMHTPPNQP
jgi:hypothetical protein